MIDPWMMYPLLMPKFSPINEKPPTIYAILNSIVNYGKEDKVKIKDLAKNGRTTIFDFDYPLSSKVSKEDFECIILNHFLMRRIGFDTVTAFQIQLNVKLNEIMQNYNILFDSLSGWDLFNDGETVTRTQNDDRVTNSTNLVNNESNSSSNNINDTRYSDTPQNMLDDVKTGKYLTDYTYVQNDTNSSDTSVSNGTSNTKDSNVTVETIKRSPADKINLYKNFIESKNNIYTMIFNDLECLFYQLV